LSDANAQISAFCSVIGGGVGGGQLLCAYTALNRGITKLTMNAATATGRCTEDLRRRANAGLF
jgi:hypothetical protein